MQNNELQERVLSTLRKTRANVTLFLMNGFQIRGQITGYDSFVVVVHSEGKQNIIYKHAISTIMPERSVELGG